MRSSNEIKKLVLDFATADERVRTVLLNGSRANSKIVPDKYQDFDIVFIVNDLAGFISDHSWTSIFGEQLIHQLPDEIDLGYEEEKNKTSFHCLMLFHDGNRIDLTLFPVENMNSFHLDSLTIVWLDKDNLFSHIAEPNDADYLIKKPTEKEFLYTCNEFWWVSTYVVKGLVRREITYSKEMLERVVRPMFMKILEWYIGINTDFSVSFGKSGKFMKKYLSETLYKKILNTYADHHLKNNWKALFIMMKLFGQLASAIADDLSFHYKTDEENKVKKYITQLYKEQN